MGERASGMPESGSYSGLPFRSVFSISRIIASSISSRLTLTVSSLGCALARVTGICLALGRVERGEVAVQRINQVVESRIGQRDLQILIEPSQGDGLIGVPRIRRQLRPEPPQRTKAPRLPVRGEFHGDEVQDTGPDDLVDQGVTLADRQRCPGVVDLPGADIEQRVGMAHRDFGLILARREGRPS